MVAVDEEGLEKFTRTMAQYFHFTHLRRRLQSFTTRVEPRQRRLSIVAGAIVVGTIFKVSYFSYSRKLIVDDQRRMHSEGMGHLQEARQFAKWSDQDRKSRLPELTDEQREQLHAYLKLVQRHGLNKAFSQDKHQDRQSRDENDDSGCGGRGCPVFADGRDRDTGKVNGTTATTTAPSRAERMNAARAT